MIAIRGEGEQSWMIKQSGKRDLQMTLYKRFVSIATAGGMLCYLPALCGPVALVIGLKSLNAIKAEPHAEVAAKR